MARKVRMRRGVRKGRRRLTSSVSTPIYVPGQGGFGVRSGTLKRVRRSHASRLSGAKRRIPAVGLRRVRRRLNSTAVGGDISFKTKLWKRRRLGVKAAIKQLTKSREYHIERLQLMNRMNAVNDGLTLPGAAALHNTFDLNTGETTCPLDLFDLTRVYNNASLGNPSVGFRLQITDAGAVQWGIRPSQTHDGTTNLNGQWAVERASKSGAVNAQYITHEWYDIRLNLYGCNTQPTYYDVMLCQLTSPEFDPFEATGAAEGRRKMFYCGLVKTLMYNPINPGDNSWNKGFKVLRRYRKVIQPSSAFGGTDTVDKNPHNHVLKIKYVPKRTLNYHQFAFAPATDTVALANQWVQTFQNPGLLQNTPLPRARMFLVVRALNTTPVSIGSATANNTPSYDFMIRRKITYLDPV